ncbi:MAG: 4Fe-4S binding protein [Candidatus Altiarchaeota archaeon]
MNVDRGKCLYCGGCVGICPVDAMELREVVIVVDEKACTRCGTCVKYCPVGAISLDGGGGK